MHPSTKEHTVQTMYPGADTSLYFQPQWNDSPIVPTRVVLHTTEGGTVYDYEHGSMAPHFTVDNGRGRVYQHFPINVYARALVHLAGDTATNTMGAVQIEVIGSCDPGSAVRPYVPGMTVAQMGPLVDLLAWIAQQTGIRLTPTPRPWLAYPGSAGDTAARMTRDEWVAFRGVAMHSHVPENQHGDAGAINVGPILAAARAKIGQPPLTPASSASAAPPKVTPTTAPPFPLPAGSYFGPRSGPVQSVSGYVSHSADLKVWQQRMQARGWTITADGLYGDQTAAVTRQFQLEKHLNPVDGKIGPATWAAAWTAA